MLKKIDWITLLVLMLGTACGYANPKSDYDPVRATSEKIRMEIRPEFVKERLISPV